MVARRSLAVRVVLCASLVRGDDETHAHKWMRPSPTSAYRSQPGANSVQLDGTINVTEYGDLLYSLQTEVSAARLQGVARRERESYAAAQPFPHVSLDGIFPNAYLRKVAGEFPELTRQEAATVVKCKLHYQESGKCAVNDDGPRVMSTPYARGLFSLLLSPDFAQFLETLTGIKGVIADTAFQGSGFHQTLPGGALAIHTDFHLNKRLMLTRRINVFLYLNPDWEDHFGGDLELWSVTKKSAQTSVPKPHRRLANIAPKWGRLVVFTTGERTFHGHPMPLNTTHRNRRSIAMYYYTNGAAKTELHEGTEYPANPIQEATKVCSGVPEGQAAAAYPKCDEFRGNEARAGQLCPLHREGAKKRKEWVQEQSLKSTSGLTAGTGTGCELRRDEYGTLLSAC